MQFFYQASGTWIRRWRWPFALFAIIAATRLIYVSLYGVDTPYWDQWDSEAALLLKPWQEGTWTLAQLVSLHNEHRIAYTRMLTLVLFELNSKQWDNLVEAYANAFLAAATFTVLYSQLRKFSGTPAKLVSFGAIAVIGVLPFSWENMLVGFQSVFYFLNLFAIVLIAVAVFRQPGFTTTALLSLIGLLALVTSASGMIAVFPVIFIVLGRAYQARTVTRLDAITVVAMLAIAFFGVWLLPSGSHSDGLEAVGVAGHFDALVTSMMWPLETLTDDRLPLTICLFFILVLWLPSLISLACIARRARTTPTTWFAVGIATFVFAQLGALAHSRGHDSVHLASRYMDLPALGLIVNAWLAANIIQNVSGISWAKGLAACSGALFLCCVFYAFIVRTPSDMHSIHQRVYYTSKETRNVAGYMSSGDPSWLDQPPLEIPYPIPERLRQLLDDKTIANILPPSIRKPLALDGEVIGFDAADQRERIAIDDVTVFTSYSDRLGSAERLSFSSDKLATSRPYLQLRQKGDKDPTGATHVWLEDANGAQYPFRSGSAWSNEVWRRSYARAVPGELRIRAVDASANHWLALRVPVEAGTLSAWAALFQDEVRRMASLPPDPADDTSAVPATHVAPPGEVIDGGECVVDLLNGKPLPTTTLFVKSNLFRLSGWAVVSSGNGIASDKVTIVVDAADGGRLYHAAQKTLRPDVLASFHRPEMGSVGFEAIIPTKGLTGLYTLKIFQEWRGKQLLCAHTTMQVNIVH
jgi:hypothetical protein